MALRLEGGPAELQSDRTTAVHQEIEPAVVSRQGKAFQGCAGADSHPHQAGAKMRDNATADNGRSAVRKQQR